MIIPGDPSQIEDGAVTIALVEAVAGNGTGPRETRGTRRQWYRSYTDMNGPTSTIGPT